MKMQTYLSVTPEGQQAALRHTRNLAHVAYRIGPNSTLLRQNFQSRGGLLSVSDLDAPEIRDPGALCAAVGRECARRSYGGVVLDFEQPPTPDRRAFVSRLDREPKRWRLFVPQSYGDDAPGAVMLLCSAISGGDLQKRMGQTTFFSPELCARYFTYQQEGQLHFILYDDAETMNRKVRIAAELGLSAAFFVWPEVEDIAPKIRW